MKEKNQEFASAWIATESHGDAALAEFALPGYPAERLLVGALDLDDQNVCLIARPFVDRPPYGQLRMLLNECCRQMNIWRRFPTAPIQASTPIATPFGDTFAAFAAMQGGSMVAMARFNYGAGTFTICVPADRNDAMEVLASAVHALAEYPPAWRAIDEGSEEHE